MTAVSERTQRRLHEDHIASGVRVNRWGAELTRVLEVRGWRQVDLARELGVSEDSVRAWRLGKSLPSLDSALAASEALSWKRLATIIVELRTRDCARCGRTFVMRLNTNGMWCSRRCRQHGYWSSRNAKRSTERKERKGYLLAIWEDVGDRMCRQWCPGGREDHFCPDATCPIQVEGFCPWPLARENAA